MANLIGPKLFSKSELNAILNLIKFFSFVLEIGFCSAAQANLKLVIHLLSLPSAGITCMHPIPSCFVHFLKQYASPN
jgi:hypothetical protein